MAYNARRRGGGERAGCLARLCRRAVDAADGHHLRAAGVRAGAGVPVGHAVRPRQGAGQGQPPAGRDVRHAVAGARPHAGSAAVDGRPEQGARGQQHGARHAGAAAWRDHRRRREAPLRPRQRCASIATGWRRNSPTRRRRPPRPPRGPISCSSNCPRPRAAPTLPDRRPRRWPAIWPRHGGSWPTCARRSRHSIRPSRWTRRRFRRGCPTWRR